MFSLAQWYMYTYTNLTFLLFCSF